MAKGFRSWLSKLALIFVIPSTAGALETFEPARWSKGLHLLGGIGLHSAVFKSDQDEEDWGVGSYVRTDLAYFLNESWALEWSSGIKLNHVKEGTIWDTNMTIGFRYRFNQIPLLAAQSAYVRLFHGRSPTIAFLSGDSEETFRERGVDRLQFDGPITGLSLGAFRKTQSGRVWYCEVTYSHQNLEEVEGIKEEGDVPVVVFHDTINVESVIHSFYLSIGTIFF